MRNKLLTLLFLATSTSSQANIVNIDFGLNHWINDASGTLNTSTDIHLDSDDRSSTIWVKIEHPVPLLPNLRISQTLMDYSGNEFSTEVDVSHGDAIAYYQLLDSHLELDIGLGIKRFLGEIDTRAIGLAPVYYALDNTLPVAYAMAAFALPNSPIDISLELQQGDNGDDSLSEANFMLRYTTANNIGLGVGYRFMQLELESKEDGYTARVDSEFKGLQFSLSFHL